MSKYLLPESIMLPSELFKPDSIKIHIESEDKEELFEEMVNHLVDTYDLNNREEVLTNLWERERKMTTGIAPRIAIPHAQIGSISTSIGVLGISRDGIDYDSLDGGPVHLIFLIIGNTNDPGLHLKILKNLAQLLESPDFYDQMIKANSASEVSETLIEFEDLQIFKNKGV